MQHIGPENKFNKIIKARTLDNLCMIFVVPISNYTVEPGTLEKAGQILLTKFGLHNYVQDWQVIHCKLYVSSLFLHCYLLFLFLVMHKHKLDQHDEPCQYLGHEHLSLVLMPCSQHHDMSVTKSSFRTWFVWASHSIPLHMALPRTNSCKVV